MSPTFAKKDLAAQKAAREYVAASRNLAHARLEALEIGREVSWERPTGNVVWGTVVDHSVGADRVLVKSNGSGRQYWVSCWGIRQVNTR